MSRSGESGGSQDLSVEDAEQTVQSIRMKELLERRRMAIQASTEARVAASSGEVPPEQAKLWLLDYIRPLILDLWTKFADVGKSGEDYLQGVRIGSMTVPVPESLPQTRHDDRLAPGASVPKPKRIDVEGLQWFVETEFPIEVAWSVRTVENGPGVMTDSVSAVPPFQLLWGALTTCSEFMNDLGLDIEVHAEEGDAKFDYSDLLEEGPGGEFPDLPTAEGDD